MRKRPAQEWDIPGTLRRKIQVETMRGWLADYRRGGFDALMPKQRSDAGTARAIPQPVADLICETKEQHPDYSVAMAIDHVTKASAIPEGVVLAPSTVHRTLSLAGMMQKKPGEPTSKDRRRFSFELAGELWMSDVMHGPAVMVAGRQRKTYLIAIIDDATRLVSYVAFALCETASAFLTALEQAIRRRGVPKRIYVDNGAAFRAQQLSMVCAKLGITLIHARPYTPQGKGKVESGVKYVKNNCLRGRHDQELPAVNAELKRWVLEIAGARVHGTTGRRPLEVFTSEEQAHLLPLPERRYETVVWKQATVHADCHVNFDKRLYSVPWRPINQEVWLRATASSVVIYADDVRVATHSRRGQKQRSTQDEHLPEGRAELRHRSRQYWEERADRISADVGSFVREVFVSDDVLLQLRAVQAIVTYLEKFPLERASAAARRASFYGSYSYQAVKNILIRALDLEPLPTSKAKAAWADKPRFARDLSKLANTEGGNECH